ncbi:zinc finger C4H2 domain-containing protein-like [Acanthaster planci]|uniref:Zinc finger C4H2 domain-containing protein-like n=1 Tax=Acanthaster planci TaxID=133434 RepID=A0A8B7YE21_ACAPL|nr:zinc finger C4H2 domain-containing protein-like [Acanthaster planci]
MELEHETAELLYKMERIKEIRSKAVQLEKLKARLLQEVEETESEEERMKEYRNEMDLLNQEKMAHVEELRQIHADINAIENVVKHAEQDRNRSFESACQAYEEYMSLKGEIDAMRNAIGLDTLPSLNQDDGRLTPSYFRKRKSEWQKEEQADAPLPTPLTIPATTSPTFQLPSTSHSEERPPFRQQPPPMKNCLSCHQQIHRNAPICPLCKAKSRSRNPKKPKRKQVAS